MARIKLQLPDEFVFSMEIPVRVTDLNYGNHLGNDAVLALAHEARVQFLSEMGYSESDIEGAGIIMSDAVIVYKSQAFLGDLLQIDIAVDDFSRRGCDLLYRVSKKETGDEVARVKTGIVFFDYSRGKTVSVPESFRKRFT